MIGIVIEALFALMSYNEIIVEMFQQLDEPATRDSPVALSLHSVESTTQ